MTDNNLATNTSSAAPSIVTILFLLIFYPLGLVVMWLWPKWKTWLKITITVVPIGLVAIIVLSLPYLTPSIEKKLAPLSECVNSCNTSDINDPCILTCQENYPNNSMSK